MSSRMKSFAPTLAAISLLGAMVATSSAYAQENGRFQLEATESGYVRLDTRMGTISMCIENQEQIVCKMATEDREAYENDLSDLQNRVKELETKVAKLEKNAPSLAIAQSSAMPSEEEFEQTMSYMERFMRRFMDITKSFDSEPAKPAEPSKQ